MSRKPVQTKYVNGCDDSTYRTVQMQGDRNYHKFVGWFYFFGNKTPPVLHNGRYKVLRFGVGALQLIAISPKLWEHAILSRTTPTNMLANRCKRKRCSEDGHVCLAFVVCLKYPPVELQERLMTIVENS